MITLAYIDPGSIVTVGSGLAWILAFLVSFLATAAVLFRKVWEWIRHHWRMVTSVMLAIAAGGAVLSWSLARRGDNTMANRSFKNRMIIIGLDGLSPEIIEPMLAAGKLPNFSRLRDSGGYWRVATTNPAESPVAWATFATGRNPGKHGVYDFIRRSPASYLPDLSLTRLEGNRALPVRKTKAFWQYGREVGVPVSVLACPVTFPPDEVNGVLLSGMGTPDLLGTQGTFSFYTTANERTGADTGGEVHVVSGDSLIKAELLGPRKQGLTGKVERLAVPFEVTIHKDRGAVTIDLQGSKLVLTVGQWSTWQSVQFKVGPLRKIHGILRFNLQAVDPYLKLYASPICIDPRNPFFPVSYPADFSRKIFEESGLFNTRGMPFDTWALNEGRLSEEAFIEDARSLYEERVKLLDTQLQRFDAGVFFCYFEYPDIIQHMYWRFIDPQHPLYQADAPPKLSGMIDDCYRKMDSIVGLVLSRLGPSDTLIVLSDHGFGTWRRAVHLNSWLVQEGYMRLREPWTGTGGPLFSDVDWSQTQAYALGFGGIYLNRIGREPQGIVSPEEASRLQQEIAGRLARLVDPTTGTPVAHRVYLQQEIFHGPDAPLAPDLYVGFEKGYGGTWQTALGAAPQGLVEDSLKKWGGTHLVDPTLVPGVLFCNRRVTKPDPSLYDFAPRCSGSWASTTPGWPGRTWTANRCSSS